MNKIADFLLERLNIGVFIAIFLTTLFVFFLNFIPETILIRMKILSFLDSYNGIIFIILISSFFVLIVLFVNFIIRKMKIKKTVSIFKKQQQELFEDEVAYDILLYLYETHPEPRLLHINNQKVKLLSQYDLIVRVSNQVNIPYYEIHNPKFPYVLQTVSEEMLKSKIR